MTYTSNNVLSFYISKMNSIKKKTYLLFLRKNIYKSFLFYIFLIYNKYILNFILIILLDLI
jgi:hypothetical protein